MSQQLKRLIPQLQVPIKPVYRRLRNPEGSHGRLKRLRALVTNVVRDERIFGNYNGLDEARPYVERLVQDAVRLGDADSHVMEMANFWLADKQLVYKLFQVLAPRFADQRGACTRVFFLPLTYRKDADPRSHPDTVLELKGHPFPPIIVDPNQYKDSPRMLHNILLDAARKEYAKTKHEELLMKANQELSAADADNGGADGGNTAVADNTSADVCDEATEQKK